MTAQTPPTERAPMRSLTRGQIAVLTLATLPMIAVGAGGALGTYANASSVLHNSRTALGVVAAGEGATLVAALVMIGVTMLGQAAPAVVRAALWLLPMAASCMGLAIAPDLREAVVYALTPLAMTAAAEGISFLARRIVSHTTGVDIEAQRHNAAILRRIAYHRARAERHPWKWVQKYSALAAWRLMRRAGDGDTQLGSGLIAVQRDRLTQGADIALMAMLTGGSEPSPAQPVSPALEPADPGEPTGGTVIVSGRGHAAREPRPAPALPASPPIIKPGDQDIRREPVLSPAEPAFAKTAQGAAETGSGEPVEPELGGDEKEQQIAELAHRLTIGERLTKTSAAQILGVSPATAGRRLKDARDRVGEGTGFYA